MEDRKDSTENLFFFEEIVKKTKTGITFPKDLRESLFEEGKDIFFKLIVPVEKDKIILEILSDDQVKELSERIRSKKSRKREQEREPRLSKKTLKPTPNWGNYFLYGFENKEKVKPILESAFYRFSETPVNLEDAMGRIKYALVSFLSSTKTENAKLYYAVERFLIDVIERFDHPNLIDWIFEKIIPSIESKFLYELGLSDLVEISLKTKRYEKAELFMFYVLKNIDDYPKSEMYNVMNSFKQLVKKVKFVERSDKIDILLKEKLMEYGEGIDDVDYKIQIIEFLEDLKYTELAYDLAKKIQVSLAPDSFKLEVVRSLVRRLHRTPIESKPNSSLRFEDEGSDD